LYIEDYNYLMLIQNLRKRLSEDIYLFLEKSSAVNKSGIPKKPDTLNDKVMQITLSIPKNREFGDLSTNAALVLAPVLKKSPLKIAEEIKNNIIITWPEAADINIAAPGFINFFISRDYILNNLEAIALQKYKYGCNKHGKNIKVQIEFVSANPTGGLHIGHGRWAALGDSLSNIFISNGFDVCREYYINDFGSQTAKFSLCLASIYLKAFGQDTEYPQDGYPEELVKSVVDQVLNEEKLTDGPGFKGRYIKNKKSDGSFKKITGRAGSDAISEMADIDAIGLQGIGIMIKRIAASLKSMNVEFDEWFYESSLYKNANFEKTIQQLEKEKLVYRKDDALWFKAALHGDEKDRVVVRSGGEPTYFASDIMYLINKAGRRFKKLIYILGADHHGYIKRLHAIGKATGFDERNIEVIIGQLVRLVKKGKAVKMSKRKGHVYMLDDLIEEVGSDAIRYFFTANSFNTPMDFDLDLAKQKSNQNPVYYIQYAHARIANIIDKVRQGIAEQEIDFDRNDLILPGKWSDNFEDIFEALISENSFKIPHLESNEEADLAKMLMLYPDVVYDACICREPYMINQYLYRLAGQFHYFYKHHRVIDGKKLNSGRFKLVLLTRIVLANALKILGVGAPERM